MNYNWLHKAPQSEVKKFISYMEETLWRNRKFGWGRGMEDVWEEGLRIAKEIL